MDGNEPLRAFGYRPEELCAIPAACRVDTGVHEHTLQPGVVLWFKTQDGDWQGYGLPVETAEQIAQALTDRAFEVRDTGLPS